jgi:hypothetical protein
MQHTHLDERVINGVSFYLECGGLFVEGKVRVSVYVGTASKLSCVLYGNAITYLLFGSLLYRIMEETLHLDSPCRELVLQHSIIHTVGSGPLR